MLILTRKKDESLIIDGKIEIKIITAEDGKVKIGIDAPRNVEIHRKEIFDKIQEENIQAKTSKDQINQMKNLMKSKKVNK